MATRNSPVRMIPFAMWTLPLVPLGLVLSHLRFEVFKIVHRILESHGEFRGNYIFLRLAVSVCLSYSISKGKVV